MAAIWQRFIFKGLVVASVALATLVIASPIYCQTASYTGSLQFATGDYFFDQRTSGLSLLSGLSLSLGSFHVSASIPMVYQSTPYVSYSGVGVIPSGGSEHMEVKGRQGKKQVVVLPEVVEFSEIGIGDPLVHTDLELWKEGKMFPSFRIVAEVKVPLASIDQGFGTGEWDYSGGISLAKAVGSTFVLLDITYWILGDMPDLELKDTLSYSIALGKPLAGGKFALLASYSAQTRIIDEIEAPALIGIGLSCRLDSKKSLAVNVSFGLTESTPDFSLSLGWSIGL